MREKLIELQKSCCKIEKCKAGSCFACMADHLIANGVTIQRWIPVTEQLPEVAHKHNTRWDKSTDSIRVLCVCVQKDGKKMVKEGYCKVSCDGSIYWKIPGTIDSVTHWMPLPPAPEDVK